MILINYPENNINDSTTINIYSKPLERVQRFKYIGVTLTNKGKNTNKEYDKSLLEWIDGGPL